MLPLTNEQQDLYEKPKSATFAKRSLYIRTLLTKTQN